MTVSVTVTKKKGGVIMTLIKWTPKELVETKQELGRFFEDFLRPLNELSLSNGSSWQPTANIAESKDAYEISLELPGLKKDDIEVNLENNTLTVIGKREEEKQEKSKEYHRIERRYGSFCRSFSLPTRVEAGKIHASYEDGLLEVTVPKAEEAKKKTVKVEVS